MTLRELLPEINGRVVVLIRCADPRVSTTERLPGGLYLTLAEKAKKVFEIAAEGAARKFGPSSDHQDEAMRLHQHVLGAAEVVVVCAHGDCAKYKDDSTSLQDNRLAAGCLHESLGKQVYLLWQEDPAVPQIEVVQVWHP